MSTHAFPPASQRRHWYVYVIGSVPVQRPRPALSVLPSLDVPDSEGAEVFAGAVPVALTTPVGADVAVVDPDPFDAVTATRSRRPMSPVVTVYCRLLAPPIGLQFAPAESQRSHW